MYCLRCGSETQEEKVFCDVCLEDMEQYPVKPGTVVTLPRQNETATSKKTAPKRQKTADDQLSAMKKLVGWMCALLLIAVGLLTLAMLQLLQMP